MGYHFSQAPLGTYVPMPTGPPSVGDVPTVTNASPVALDWAAGGGGGGGAGAGALVTHKFPFAFNTPNLLTGATAVFTDGYVPAIGDILHDIWMEVDTAWDGITPQGDVGSFTGTGSYWPAGGITAGLWNTSPGVFIDMAKADSPYIALDLLGESSNGTLGSWQASTMYRLANEGSYPQGQGIRILPAKFITADPLKVVVSQDGTTTGADPGSTQGAAILYVVTSSP